VVLECGKGCGIDAWGFVQPQVARFARVCAFDRAGIGWSDAAAGTRDAVTLTEELHRALDAAGVTRPFAYVAHSAASFHALVYAQRYPRDVSGVVFVEGSHYAEVSRSQGQRVQLRDTLRLLSVCKNLAAMGIPRWLGAAGLFELPPRIDQYPSEARGSARASAYRTGYCDTLRREILAFEQSANQASSVQLPRSLPIVSLSGLASDRHGPTPHVDLDRRLAQLSDFGEHWTSLRSGHYPQLEHPEWVSAAVQRVMRTSKRKTLSEASSSVIRHE
jgi:pimeloyl-ACP methyl ester carboxylesterase